MDPMILMAISLIGIGLGVGGWSIYMKEVVFPERILVKKEREGSMTIKYQLGKVRRTKDDKGNVTGKELFLAKDKIAIPVNPDYKGAITTSMLNRQKRFWEVYSPNNETYCFSKPTVIEGQMSNKALSQFDKQLFISMLREAAYRNEPPKNKLAMLSELLMRYNGLITFFGVIISVIILNSEITSMVGNIGVQLRDVIIEAFRQGANVVQDVSGTI